MIEILEPNFKFGDDRGSLTQLVREGYRQVNVIKSKAGASRGGHYHKLNREAFFIMRFDVSLRMKKLTEQGEELLALFRDNGICCSVDYGRVCPELVAEFS